jgi:GDP-4-dehydro-6-deoxy-D-mannose reductase
MKILVTGASGFIGRNLVTFLRGEGHEVIGTFQTPGELVARGVPSDGVRWEHLEMQDPVEIERVIESTRADGVFHLAAQAYAKKAWADPADTFRTNVLGTIYLYEALRKHPAREGVLLASSGSAYGIPSQLPIREDLPLNATNPYGVSKATQDMLSLQYALNFEMRILRARLFGTTGPGKTGDAMNDFARQVVQIESSGAPGSIRVGNLDSLRDISDVRDVIRAMVQIFARGTPTEPVNVGAGRSFSIRYVAETLVRLARVPVRLEPDPALLRPTDEPDNRPDISRLRALGFQPEFPLDRTIADALDYWREGSPKTPGPPA